MKALLILLALISFKAFAGYVAESQMNNCNRVLYSESGQCQDIEGEACFKTPEVEKSYCGVYKFKNIHSSSSEDEETCLGESCLTLLSSKVCSDNHTAFINEDFTAVYCREIIGKELVVDSVLYAQKEAEEISKKQFESAMAQAEKAMNCGKSAQKLLLVRNSSKGLTTAQIKQMVSIYAPIKELLDTGSLVSAAEEIAVVEADGVLVTADDKTALTNHLTECMAQ